MFKGKAQSSMLCCKYVRQEHLPFFQENPHHPFSLVHPVNLKKKGKETFIVLMWGM